MPRPIASPPAITRRKALGIGAGVAAAAAACAATTGRAAAPAEKPSLHVYDNYAWLRGFSVVPSWGARIEEAWWFYDGPRFREEVSLARQVHANCIRLWIEFTAWTADRDKIAERFLDAVKAIAEAGMTTMPCLFNRWHDRDWDYGGTYVEHFDRNWEPMKQYVATLVKPLGSDERILIWDLCNEPRATNPADREVTWLAAMADVARRAGAKQPITVGTTFGANIDAFASICDVLCGHPYPHDRAGLEAALKDIGAVKKKRGKPMLVNECMPGSLDDRKRAAYVHMAAPLFEASGYGWMGWALREGKAVSTRRDRYDANGLNNEGFHPFFTREGKLRPGLEFLTEKPRLRPPWEKG